MRIFTAKLTKMPETPKDGCGLVDFLFRHFYYFFHLADKFNNSKTKKP